MKTVTRATFDRRTSETFVWEAETDVNQFGKVQVRDTRSNRRFVVEVR
jgi:hypothetical protein